MCEEKAKTLVGNAIKMYTKLSVWREAPKRNMRHLIIYAFVEAFREVAVNNAAQPKVRISCSDSERKVAHAFRVDNPPPVWEVLSVQPATFVLLHNIEFDAFQNFFFFPVFDKTDAFSVVLLGTEVGWVTSFAQPINVMRRSDYHFAWCTISEPHQLSKMTSRLLQRRFCRS